jgi:hypothetical protein
VGEKTPTPDGPPSTPVAAVEELVTVPGGAVVPVDNSLVVVADDGALVDELVPEVVVVETASCARADDCQSINKSRAAIRRNKRGSENFMISAFFISRSTRPNPNQTAFFSVHQAGKSGQGFLAKNMCDAE